MGFAKYRGLISPHSFGGLKVEIIVWLSTVFDDHKSLRLSNLKILHDCTRAFFRSKTMNYVVKYTTQFGAKLMLLPFRLSDRN